MQPVEPDLKLDGFSLWVFGRQFPDANDTIGMGIGSMFEREWKYPVR
jgi:hypothetical protein